MESFILQTTFYFVLLYFFMESNMSVFSFMAFDLVSSWGLKGFLTPIIKKNLKIIVICFLINNFGYLFSYFLKDQLLVLLTKAIFFYFILYFTFISINVVSILLSFFYLFESTT